MRAPEPKVAREVAESEVRSWAEVLGTSFDPAAAGPIVAAVMAGRVIFDAASESFTVQLRKPIKLENGKAIDSLTIGEPTGGQILAAGKLKDQVSQSYSLLASVTGLDSPALIERMVQRDITVASGLLGFFA